VLLQVDFSLLDYAKYPFLEGAGHYVEELDIRVEELWDKGMKSILQRAEERVMEAVKDAKVSDKSLDREVELLSFPAAMLLVKASGADHILGRYSLAEARRAEQLLQQEDERTLRAVFRSAAAISLGSGSDYPSKRSYDFKMSVTDYLRRAVLMSEPSWKLVNRPVKKGWVFLNRKDAVRLLREDIRRLILERLNRLPRPKVSGELKPVVERLRTRIPPPPPQPRLMRQPSEYPPCLTHAVNDLKSGVNVPHYGRFLIATYLLKIGKSVDDVVNLFPRAPDFNEKITRYQVEHIGGLRGGRVQYTPPSCRTLQTHGLCYKDEIKCYNIRNPLQYPSRYQHPSLRRNLDRQKNRHKWKSDE
jgi:DNA primase large subunit